MINRYFPPIQMQGISVEVAREILRQSKTINVIQGRVEVDLCMRKWTMTW